MAPQDTERRAPIVAAFSPRTAAREPVEFGIAASRITGAPLVIVAVRHADSLVTAVTGDSKKAGARAEALTHLEHELEQSGVDVELRVFEDHTAARGLARAMDELRPELMVVGPV